MFQEVVASRRRRRWLGAVPQEGDGTRPERARRRGGRRVAPATRGERVAGGAAGSGRGAAGGQCGAAAALGRPGAPSGPRQQHQQQAALQRRAAQAAGPAADKQSAPQVEKEVRRATGAQGHDPAPNGRAGPCRGALRTEQCGDCGAPLAAADAVCHGRSLTCPSRSRWKRPSTAPTPAAAGSAAARRGPRGGSRRVRPASGALPAQASCCGSHRGGERAKLCRAHRRVDRDRGAGEVRRDRLPHLRTHAVAARAMHAAADVLPHEPRCRGGGADVLVHDHWAVLPAGRGAADCATRIICGNCTGQATLGCSGCWTGGPGGADRAQGVPLPRSLLERTRLLEEAWRTTGRAAGQRPGGSAPAGAQPGMRDRKALRFLTEGAIHQQPRRAGPAMKLRKDLGRLPLRQGADFHAAQCPVDRPQAGLERDLAHSPGRTVRPPVAQRGSLAALFLRDHAISPVRPAPTSWPSTRKHISWWLTIRSRFVTMSGVDSRRVRYSLQPPRVASSRPCSAEDVHVRITRAPTHSPRHGRWTGSECPATRFECSARTGRAHGFVPSGR